MARKWQKVSLGESRRHPLYGVKNWLAVFAFGVLLGPLRELVGLAVAAEGAGVTIRQLLAADEAAGAYAKGVLAFDALWVAVVYCLLFTKHRTFRPVAIAFLVAWWPVCVATALATGAPYAGNALALAALPWAMSCTVWGTYLQRSRRVRVTFENAVLREAERVPSPPSMDMRASPAPITRPEHRPLLQTQELRATHDTLPLSPPAAVKPATRHEVDEALWAQALAELDGAGRRQGLWARVFAEANGNEAVAKAQYLSERAGHFSEQVRKEQAVQAAALAESNRRQAERRARFGKIRSEFVSGGGWPLEHIGDLVKAVETEPAYASLTDRVHGRTLLHWCAKHNLRPQAMTLLEHGASADAPDGDGRRPYELAENLELREILRAAAAARRDADVPRRL